MKQGLSLRVSQHLALTPQLQQSIRLLQLSTLELNQEVEQMLSDNPFLEREPDSLPDAGLPTLAADVTTPRDEAQAEGASYLVSAAGASSSDHDEDGSDKLSWDGDGSSPLAPDDSEWGGEARAHGTAAGDDDGREAADSAAPAPSLASHLRAQTVGLCLNPHERAALWFLIESLNEDGYLEDSLSALAAEFASDDVEQTGQLLHHFNVALALLQSLEPTGVGARSLAECLTLQLQALARALATPATLVTAAICICQQALPALARSDVAGLMKVCGADNVTVRQAMALIARLEPKPGRRFFSVEQNVVLPDVIVTQSPGSGKLIVRLNAEVMPRLRLHDLYANILRSRRGRGQEAGQLAALQQHLQEARWFIKNIEQRFATILRVSSAIVQRQKSFFTHGALAMRPLVLREIAAELGLHESTISRVTSGKYMSTPLGTFELKYFFGSGLATDSGGSASSTAVRALIKEFIAAENPLKPLSDQQLSLMLKEQGIACARRTVAKYRESLHIAPTPLRKTI